MIIRLLDERRRGGDDGFALIFVLLVTTMVMLGVTAALAAVTPNINGAKRSEDAMAALTAARSGVDDLIAYLTGIPSCRSETKVCPNALGASSVAITGARQRPVLGTGQSFSWTTNPVVTTEGYVRVTSKGTSNGVSRSLVADLSLQPSILSYGYYSDYESLSPQFLTSYYSPRSIYISNASIYASTTYASSSNTVPRYANWAGPKNASDCGQHWYSESATSPGRSSNGSNYDETGRISTTTSQTTGGSATARTGKCDLVFSSAMVQDGKTFTRDALLSSGAGPKFNQPVYTMWGYDDGNAKRYNTPAPPAGQYYRMNDNKPMSNTPNLPAVATADLVLPKTIGMDGLAENACVYTGPTRVKLNGDGTATITSPATTVKNAASDLGCYPIGAIGGTGVVGWKINYQTVGSGTVIVRQRGTAPASGWPANPTRSTQTAAATNEVFYLPATGGADVVRHTDTSTAPTGCTSSVRYSAAVGAACAWTNLATAVDGAVTNGWAGYTSAKCSNAQVTDRQLFECEYGSLAATSQPALNQAGGWYGTLRTEIQTELAKGNCLTGTAAAQADCIEAMVQSEVSPANSTKVRYVATSTAGTQIAGTPVVGTAASSAVGNDDFFQQPTAATETVARTPITTVVKRQTYSSLTGWNSGTPAFTFTVTQADYTYTAPRGAAYFPNTADVTAYNTGTDGAGATASSTGVNQPADLYVDGSNKGKLSLVADNDVIITGNINNPVGYTPATDALSIAAGKNVRNYHPVSCVDQDAADINNTSPGWCPSDITGLTGDDDLISNNAYEAAHPARQYVNMLSAADRNVDAAVFALSGSLRTDNYNRGAYVGYLNINGGVYQAFRGGNGVISGTNQLSGTTLQYRYVDLQRAELPYAPPASSGNYSRPWDVVSISAGPS